MKIIKKIFIFAFALFLLTTLSYSADLYVNGTGPSCGTGTNYSTIQAAINGASAGDTIHVCKNGSSGYSENVIVYQSVNIYGNESYVTVTAASASSPTFTINTTYVNMTNLTITGASSGSGYGVWLNSTSGYAHIWGVNSSDNRNGFFIGASSNNNISYNLMNNNSDYGIEVYTLSNNNTVGFNNITHGVSGINVYQNNNNSVISNVVYNMTTWSMFVSLSNNGTFSGNTFNNSWYGPVLQSSNDNIFTSNTIGGNSVDGLQVQGSNRNNISGNTIFNNYQIGINIILNSENNRIYSNTIENHTNGTGAGIILTSINVVNHIYNNAQIKNNIYGIFVNSSNVTNITNNTAYNNSYGFVLYSSSSNNNLTSNNASSNSAHGFFLNSSSNNNNLTSNTASDNTNHGFFISSNSTNNVLTLNNASSSTFGFLLFSDFLNNLTSNTATNSVYGFSLNNSRATAFSGNNVTNATTSAFLLVQANLTFSGNNGVYSIPSSGVEIYLENGSIFNTSSYNITTTYVNFQVYSENTSVKTVNLTNASGTNYQTATTILGVSTTSRKVVQNSLGYYYGLNVTNLTASPTLSLKLFYDSSDLTGYTTTYLGIGSSSTAGTWTYYSSTVNTTEASVYYSPITSFSYFAPIVYVPYVSDGAESSDPGTMTVTTAVSCDGDNTLLTVTVKEGSNLLDGATVRVISSGLDPQNTVDGLAVFTFTLNSDKSYNLKVSKSGYSNAYVNNVAVPECEAEEVPETPEAPETPETPEVPETPETPETPEPPVIPEDPEFMASQAIAMVQYEIELAKEEGKLTEDAEAKLLEAQEAYDSGDYELAQQLAEEALTLITEEQAPPGPEPEPEPQPQPEPQEDNSWLMYLAVLVILIVLVGGYFLLKGKKKGYKGYKR